MATFQVQSRNPDGSTYFSELAMGNWAFQNIVEMVSRGFNGTFVEKDYISVQMSAVPGFPQLFFRLYGDFTFVNGITSGGNGTYVAAGSLINSIEVIDASGFVYDRIDGISFAFNSDKTTVGIEPINIFANSFRPGEIPIVELLLGGNDYITGNSGTEVLFGFAGADAMEGRAGVDALWGGEGADTLNGGADADDLYGEAGNDVIVGYTAGDYIDGGADFDTWVLTGTFSSGIGLPVAAYYSGVSFYNVEAIKIIWGQIVLNSNQVGGTSTVQTILAGSANRDAMRVDMAAGEHVMNLSTVNFVDWNNWSGDFDLITLNGSNEADTIDGSSMGDSIFAGNGANIVRGGGGSDRISGGDDADILRGGDLDDTISGWGGNDILIGDDDYSQNPATLVGGDTLYGGTGNDFLMGLRGFNVLDGGDGTDTVDYRFLAQNPADTTQYPVTVSVNLSTAVNPNDPNSAFSAYVIIDLTEVYFPVVHDILVGIENVNGSNYVDGIIGNDLGNQLVSFAGDDELFGRGGNDGLNGGTGNDRMDGEDGDDNLTGGAGNDVMDGGANIDRAIFSSAFGVTVNLGLTGAQVTGEGTDTLTNIENLVSGKGNDRLTGSVGANNLNAGDGNDTLAGGAGADTLTGGAGNDALYGSDGVDVINGGIGNDIINSGLGGDVVTGGTGADRFIFNTALPANIDRITDYRVVDDVMALDNAVFTGLVGPVLTGAAFKNLGLGVADTTDRILWNPVNGALYFDIDGAGGVAAVRFGTVLSVVALTAAEFQII